MIKVVEILALLVAFNNLGNLIMDYLICRRDYVDVKGTEYLIQYYYHRASI